MHYTDQTATTIELKTRPLKLVSLVPSQTELLYYLDIKPIAQTIFCYHPKDFFKKAIKIGGTKKLNINKIKELKPDLIIGNKEENQKEQIEELRKFFPVWLSDIYTVNDAVNMIKEIGKMTGTTQKADILANEIESGFDTMSPVDKGTTLYLIWKDPYMAAGHKTFINSVLCNVGYRNILPNEAERYPTLTLQQIRNINPENILLSSEPFPFKEKHVEELKKHLPACTITLVDGELYSWYGPRLLKTIDTLGE